MLVKKIIKYGGFILFTSLTFVLYYLEQPMLLSIATLSLSLIFLLFISTKNKQTVFTLNDFIVTFTQFRVALDSNANVFHALNACLEIAKEPVKTILLVLHDEMMSDHTINPYLRFAKHFNNTIVNHIMINIYLLINHGIDQKRLWQFNYIFESLIKSNYDETIALHTASYERFDLFLYLGTTIVLVTILLNVMNLIGGVIGG